MFIYIYVVEFLLIFGVANPFLVREGQIKLQEIAAKQLEICGRLLRFFSRSTWRKRKLHCGNGHNPQTNKGVAPLFKGRHVPFVFGNFIHHLKAPWMVSPCFFMCFADFLLHFDPSCALAIFLRCSVICSDEFLQQWQGQRGMQRLEVVRVCTVPGVDPGSDGCFLWKLIFVFTSQMINLQNVQAFYVGLAPSSSNFGWFRASATFGTSFFLTSGMCISQQCWSNSIWRMAAK